ncbi:RHS repeat domain-containing protein [Flavobacterium covae]|uniref:RHS repeat domain-containing protein n=1 Tax=Flavobacterium covae TaxID=2906076 RepID=UPI003397DD66
MNGQLSQHVEYIPFGEVLFEEHSSSISMPYLFNGKELDRETNLTYYGARYLDMKTSLWLNIDPLAEKYPNISPYVYCFNNPINAIDPDGRKILFVNGHYNSALGWLIGSSSPYKDYWGKGFGEAAQKFFNDYSSLKNYNYINGSSSYGGDQSGADREQLGYDYAVANYHLLIEGLAEGEAFQMVTHSEGGAYGAGIARYLIEKGHKVENVVHLSTDEGDEFETPWGPNTYQLSYYGDWVTGNKEIGNGGVDYFGVVDRFKDKSDRISYSHGSTKSASVFKELKAMQELIKKSDKGGHVPSTNATSSGGVKFKELKIHQQTTTE